MDENADAAGYVMALPYPLQHHDGLNPVLQAAVLAAEGYPAPSVTGPFTYLELGCGPGLSLLAHAAAHPGARFVGVDINPQHIRYLTETAGAAGLRNVKAIEGSFADLDSAAVGRCDFIAMHGVWSWVSAQNRSHLRTVVDRALKPGGALYLSYNCLPGMAGIMPLRELMLLAPPQADLVEQIGSSVAFATAARQAGLKFLDANPSAAARLEEIRSAPVDYLAHEYFNRDWSAFYHRDVAAELRPLGLTYAASVHASENLEQANYGPAARELISGLDQSADRETLKDFISNRPFRSDLFVRGGRTLPRAAADRQLRRVGWALACRPEDFPAGAPPRYRTVAQAVAARPVTIRKLSQALEGSVDLDTLQEIVLLLFAMKVLQPAIVEASDADRRAATARLNAVLMDQAAAGEAVPGLVSPVTGTVFRLNAEEMRPDGTTTELSGLLRYLGIDPQAGAPAQRS